jgi:hypothetical protein
MEFLFIWWMTSLFLVTSGSMVFGFLVVLLLGYVFTADDVEGSGLDFLIMIDVFLVSFYAGRLAGEVGMCCFWIIFLMV